MDLDYLCTNCGIRIDECVGSEDDICPNCMMGDHITKIFYESDLKAEAKGLSAGDAGYKEPADKDEIDVWRVEAKGLGTAYYENDIRVVVDMLKECDYDEGYIITKHKMNAKEYRELPEFTGF